MRTGTRNGIKVKVYDSGDEFIIEFPNGSTITAKDISNIIFDCEKSDNNKDDGFGYFETRGKINENGIDETGFPSY